MDWHPTIDAEIPSAGATITIAHKQFFGISIPAPAPKLAEPSSNLKLISEAWRDKKRLRLTLSGLASHAYEFSAAGAEYISKITGAERDGDSIRISMPSGNGYVQSTVDIQLR